MSRLPLKHKSANDVQEITTAEHNYLAYLAGLELQTSSGTYSQSSLGALGTTGDTDELIGSLNNSEYDGDVGDHGTLSVTNTTTNIYQQSGSVPSLPANFRNPLYQSKTGIQQEIREFNDADQLALGETLAGIIYSNNYPGTFYLGSSAPSPASNYAVAIANVMTDTTTDADDTDTVFNLYQRKTMTSSPSTPSAISTMCVKRASGQTGNFQGLELMSLAKMKATAKHCLDRYLALNTSTNLGIGSYLIRTSAPSETGTWVQRGEAIDKRNSITQVNYTGTFSGTPRTSTTRVVNFITQYTNTRDSVTSTEDFSSSRTSTTRTEDFTSQRTSSYTGTFTSTFTGNFTSTFTSTFTGTYTNPGTTTTYNNITEDYTAYQFTSGIFNGTGTDRTDVYVNGTLVATATGSPSSIVSGGVTYTKLGQATPNPRPYGPGNMLLSKFSATTASTTSTGTPSTRISTRTSTDDFVGTFTSTFTRNFVGAPSTRNYTTTFTGSPSTRISTTQYQGFSESITRVQNFTTNFTPTFTSTFTGDTIQDNSYADIVTYKLYVRTA